MFAFLKKYWLVVLLVAVVGLSVLVGGGYLLISNLGLNGQPNGSTEPAQTQAQAPVEEEEEIEVNAFSAMTYEDYLKSAHAGWNPAVIIEDTYPYLLFVDENGNYQWYEAIQATNHDAKGVLYASGYIAGAQVLASEVQSHWTQITLLQLEVTKISPSNMMSYEAYVESLEYGWSLVLIEDTYFYAVTKTEFNGYDVIKWYLATPGLNHDAIGHKYAEGTAVGAQVSASEVQSHWTQVTVIEGDPTQIKP